MGHHHHHHQSRSYHTHSHHHFEESREGNKQGLDYCFTHYGRYYVFRVFWRINYE